MAGLLYVCLETVAFVWVPILDPDNGGQAAGHRAGKVKQEEPPMDALMDPPSVFSGGKFVPLKRCY